MTLRFEQARPEHESFIFSWLAEPHIQEFWDNTQAHKDDIQNFLAGRKEPSTYADGRYIYWIAIVDDRPFALLMSIKEFSCDDISKIHLTHLSRTGSTYTLEYMIGDPKFIGQGYGAITLKLFVDFFREVVDPAADTFFIDPATNNPRAKHVYMKAGFEHICDYLLEGNTSHASLKHHFLKKRFEPQVEISDATLDDYPVLQNMARFYVYDISKHCGFISKQWAIPNDGLYECFDYKKYFEEPSRSAHIIRVNNELAGFVLINQVCHFKDSNYNVGEFFILGKFQKQGIGQQVAHLIWQKFPGIWELLVLPDNAPAQKFWQNTVDDFTRSHFIKKKITVQFDKVTPFRIIFQFRSDTMDSGISITEAQFSDAQMITDIAILGWRKSYKGIVNDAYLKSLNLEEMNKQREQRMQQSDSFTLVAKDQDQIIGFCDFGVARDEHYGAGEIYALYVLHSHQNKGIGQELLKQAFTILEKHALQPCYTRTFCQNTSTVEFFRKHGFTQQTEVIEFIGDEDHTVFILQHR